MLGHINAFGCILFQVSSCLSRWQSVSLTPMSWINDSHHGLRLLMKNAARNRWDAIVKKLKRLVKGALDNILKFSCLAKFHWSCKKWLLIYKYKKKNSKISFKSEEVMNFLLSMHKVGMRRICITSVQIKKKNMGIRRMPSSWNLDFRQRFWLSVKKVVISHDFSSYWWL